MKTANKVVWKLAAIVWEIVFILIGFYVVVFWLKETMGVLGGH